MSTLLRAVEFLCLGLWLGSDAFLSFVVAPGAFSVLASRDQAGALVGHALGRMHFLGMVCGIIFLLARYMRTRGLASLGAPAVLCVVLMMALTAISQFTVSPRMARLRRQMGSIEATVRDSPLLAEFRQLHGVSVALEGGVLVAGLVGIFLLVRELGPQSHR